VILRAPVPLSPDHHIKDFQCGEPQLDDWLQRRALSNHASGATRCFVSLDEAHRVMGYYALAAGAVTRRDATTAVRRGNAAKTSRARPVSERCSSTRSMSAPVASTSATDSCARPSTA
jgi:hypothetical protein